MNKFFKFTDFFRHITGRDFDSSNLLGRGGRRGRKDSGFLSDRKLKLEELERRELLSVSNIALEAVLQDGTTDGNRLVYERDGAEETLQWECGAQTVETDTLILLQNAASEASLQLSGVVESGTLSWGIDGNEAFLSQYWTQLSGTNGDVITWNGNDSEGNALAAPKREFTFYVWEDADSDGVLTDGEDYRTFTVSIQRAEISICVDEPIPGSSEAFSDAMDFGHGFWDNRASSAIVESGILGENLTEYANKSIGFGAVDWNIDEVIQSVAETGNFVAEGTVVVSSTGTDTLANWANVDVYNTFVIDSLTDYLNLLEYSRNLSLSPPEYILMSQTNVEQTDPYTGEKYYIDYYETQCMTAALDALEAAGVTTGLVGTGADFEYTTADVLLVIPGLGAVEYAGTAPASIGEALVVTTADQAVGAVRDEFNADYFVDFDYPQPDSFGNYSLTELREFFALLEGIQTVDLDETDPTRQALENFIMNLSSYAQSDNVIYMDFDGHETSLADDDTPVNIVTPRYSLDGDESRTYFTCAELYNMFEAWLVTAEDFAPFNVNVTLSESVYLTARERAVAGEGNFYQRVAIGGTCDDWYAAGILEKPASGVSGPYSYTPLPPGGLTDDPTCYVFALGMGGINIGNTTSHEIGHNLGLGHQGTNTGLEYYPGANDWSPIMGSATGTLVQWANGEYPQASNTEDALVKIAKRFVDADHPTGYRPDDYAGYNKNDGVTIGDIYTATYIDVAALEAGTTSIGGIIETNEDADYFMFEITDEGESYYFTIGGIDGITNLDVRVNIYYACGDLLRAVDPSDSYSADFLFDEEPGVYYISIMGTGRATGVDGVYSDYASLGMYDIQISKPETIRVTTTEDVVDAEDGVVSLREAIAQANAVEAGTDVKIFFDVAGTFTLTNGPLTITRSMILDSLGANVIISGGGNSTVLLVDGENSDVQLIGMTLTGGIGTEVPFGSETIVAGGGVIVRDGALTLIDCTVSGNRAGTNETETVVVYDETTGEVISTEEVTEFIVNGYGGGAVVYNGSLTLVNTAIRNNEAFSGGGIYNLNGSVAIFGGSVSNNSAQEAGAGVYSQSGSLTVNDFSDQTYYDESATTTFSNNVVVNQDYTDEANEFYYTRYAASFGNARGGAIHVSTGTALVNQATISGNSVSGWFSQGAGIYVDDGGTVNVTDSTVRRNTSNGDTAQSYDVSGAGAYVNWGGSLTFENSTISGNVAVSEFTPEVVGETAAVSVEDAGGAGLYADGALTVVDSTVTGNSIDIHTALNRRDDGNGYGSRVGGAGIGGLSGTITVTNSTVSANTINIYEEMDAYAQVGGAGIANNAGRTYITDSTIDGNSVVDNRPAVEDGEDDTAQTDAARLLGLGGGILAGGTITVTDSVVSNNIAAYGAGIYVRGASLSLTGSRVETNGGVMSAVTDAETGDITGYIRESCSAVNGGGVYLDGGTLTLTGTHIAGNQTIGQGAGIYAVDDSTVNVLASSYIENNAATSEAVEVGALAGGGGLWMSGGTFHINLSYIRNNSAASVTDQDSGTDECTNRVAGGGAALIGVESTFDFAFIENNSLTVRTYDHSTDKSVYADGGGVYSDASGLLTMTNTTVSGNSITAVSAPEADTIGVIHGGGVAAQNANIDSSRFTANSMWGQVWDSNESNWDVSHIDVMANGGGFYGNGVITNSLFTQNDVVGISILNDCNTGGAAISSGSGMLTVNDCTITENMSKSLYITWDSRVQLKAAMAAETPFNRLQNMPVYGTYYVADGAVYSSNGDYNLTFNNNVAVRNCEQDSSYLEADYYSAGYRGQYSEIMRTNEKYSPVYNQATRYKEQYPDASDEQVLAYLESNTMLADTVSSSYNNYYDDITYYVITDDDGNIIERSYYQGWNNLVSDYAATNFGSYLNMNPFRYDTSLAAAADYSGNNVYYDADLDVGNYLYDTHYYHEAVLDADGTLLGYNVWTDSDKYTQIVRYDTAEKRHYLVRTSSYSTEYSAEVDTYNYLGEHTYTRDAAGDYYDEYGNLVLEYVSGSGTNRVFNAYIRQLYYTYYTEDEIPEQYSDTTLYYVDEESGSYYKLNAEGEETDELALYCETSYGTLYYQEVGITAYYYTYTASNDPLNYLGTHTYITSGNSIIDAATGATVLTVRRGNYYLPTTVFETEMLNYMLFTEAGWFNFQSTTHAATVGNYRLNETVFDGAYVNYLVAHPYDPSIYSGWTETEYNSTYGAMTRTNAAIDTGSDARAVGADGAALEFDLNHAERIYNTTVDRGAYEWQPDPSASNPMTHAQSIVVSTLDDVVANDGVISLREAIQNAWYGDTITFASYIVGGTITLTEGTLTLDKSVTINGATGRNDYNIGNVGVYIVGTSGTIFKMEGTGVSISLVGLDISGGTGYVVNYDEETPYNSVIAGGAIYSTVNDGTINITGCNIHDSGLDGHDAVSHGFSNCEGQAYGGLIYQSAATGHATTVNITLSSLYNGFIDHATTAAGGGIYIENSVLNLTGAEVTDNIIDAMHREVYGGGIAMYDTSNNGTVNSCLNATVYAYATNEQTYLKATEISRNGIYVNSAYTGEETEDMEAYGGGIYVSAQRYVSTGEARVILEGAYVSDNVVYTVTSENQTGEALAGGGGVYLDLRDYMGTDLSNLGKADLILRGYFREALSLPSGVGVEQVIESLYTIQGAVSGNSVTATSEVSSSVTAYGGGIASVYACVTLEGANVSDNIVTANNTSGNGAAIAFGGGVSNIENSDLTVTGRAFDFNQYTYVIDSVVDSNSVSATANATASAYGGGIYNNNYDAACGAIWGSSVAMDHAVVSGNTISAVSNNPYNLFNSARYKATAMGAGIYTSGQLDFVEKDYENIYWTDKEKYEQQFNVQILDNSATASGNNRNQSTDAYTAEAYGGGICYDTPDSAADIDIDNILIYGNALNVRSDRNNIIAAGGGLYTANPDSVLILTDSSVSGNAITATCPLQRAADDPGISEIYYPTVEVYGVGVYTAGGIDLYQSRACVNIGTGSITCNEVNYTYGGGIYNIGDEIVIERGRFLNNEITGRIAAGGAIYNAPISDDGGNETLSITASYIGGNSADGVYAFGAGVYNEYMSVVITQDDYTLEDYTDNGYPAPMFSYSSLSSDSLNRASRLYFNSATANGAAISSDGQGDGGGLYSTQSGRLLVTGGTLVYGNDASHDGGGVWTNRVETVTVDDGSKVYDNTAGYYGGGIFNSGGGGETLLLDQIEMYGNIAIHNAGGALYNGPSYTYYNRPSTSTGKGSNVTATNVNVHDNGAGTYGGGFYIDYSSDTVIIDSVFESNTAVMRGGAVYNNTNTLDISGTEFTLNSATGENGYGGALCNLGNTETQIADSSFTANTAYGSGGAIYNFSYAGMRVETTDFINNYAYGPYGYGGAIYNLRGDLTLVGMDPVYEINENPGAERSDIPVPTWDETWEFQPFPDGGVRYSTGYEMNYFSGNGAYLNGGAIFNEMGNIEVTNYDFASNMADNDGGAIYNQGGTVELDMENADFYVFRFSENGALGDGGAICNVGGTVNISEYIFMRNSAGGDGGAIYNDAVDSDGAAALTLFGNIGLWGEGSKFADNTAAGDGGAIAMVDGSLEVENYSFITNSAVGNGGAVFMGTDGDGMNLTGQPCVYQYELYNEYGEPVLDDDGEPVLVTDIALMSVFSQNIAQKSGGAVYNLSTSAIKAQDYSFEYNRAEANGGAIYTLGNLDLSIDDRYDGEESYAAAGKEYGLVRNSAGGYGGALYIKGESATLNHINAIGNSARYDGGAIYMNNLGSRLSLNAYAPDTEQTDIKNRYSFSENTAGGSGGAICHIGSDYAIFYCDIDGNTAGVSGGGVYSLGLNGAQNRLYYCGVSNNRAVVSGAGIANEGRSVDLGVTYDGASLLLENVLVSDNILSGDNAQGAGVYQNTMSGMTVLNSTIAGNYGTGALNTGGGVYVNSGDAEFTNSVIALNTATTGDDIIFRKGTWTDELENERAFASISAENTISSSTVEGWSHWDAADNDLYYDAANDGSEPGPLFVDPGNGDYHLVAGSIAINNGVSSHGAPLYDLDGVDREGQTAPYVIDSGAYEYTGETGGKYQYVYGEERTITVNAGEEFVVEIDHKVSTPLTDDGDVIPFVTTLSLRIHYDSNYMTFDLNSDYATNFNVDASEIVAGIYRNDNIVTAGETPFTIYSDTDDYDGDASTDSYVLISWNTQIPIQKYWEAADGFYLWAQSVVSAGFTVLETAPTGSSTKINFTARDKTYDYDFYSQSIIVSVIAQNFDVDANGAVDMATDVNLILRYFRDGMRGDSLRENLLNEFSTRGNNANKTNDIESYLEKNRDIFDIDGDGIFTIGVDDVLLERYFAGLRGDALVANLTFYGATRTSAEEIEAYIAQYDVADELVYTQDKYHVVTAGGDDAEINAVIGQSVTVVAEHSLDTLAGIQEELEATTLSLRVHFNSEILAFDAVSTKIGDQYLDDLISAGDVFCVVCDDDKNYDGDTVTDKYILITWNESKTTWWQGNSPMSKLLSFVFTVNAETSTGFKMDEASTSIRFTAADLTAGYQFRGSDLEGGAISSVVVNLESGNFDIDNDGLVNTSQDGNLFLRRVISGVWGDNIAMGISDVTKRDETIAYIVAHIDNGSLFDIDGDGCTDARDANILVRYLSNGWNDHRLVDGLLDDNSTRVVRDSYGNIDYDASGALIAAYIEQFIPDGTIRLRLETVSGFSVETTNEDLVPGESVDVAIATYGSISLVWNAVAGASSYTIGYRLNGLGDDWTYIKGISATSYELTGLKSNSRYEIQISAVSFDPNTDSSVVFELDGDSAPATVAKFDSAPSVVSEKNTGAFTVEDFGPNSDDKINDDYYQIEYTAVIDGVTSYAENVDTVDNLLEGDYTVRVRSGWFIDGVYYLSDWSDSTNVTVEIERIASPTVEDIFVDGGFATVTMAELPAGSDAFEYRYRAVGAEEWSETATTDELSFVLNTLSPSVGYELQVRAVDVDGNPVCDSFWTTENFTTSVSALTINPIYDADGKYGLSVSWNAYAGADGYEYVVSADPQTDPMNPEATDKHDTSTETSVTVCDLNADTIYYVWVRAKVGAASSDWANAWERTQLAPVENFGVKTDADDYAAVTTDSITLVWDAVTDAESYTINYRVAGSSDAWTSFNGITATEYALTGLAEATPYDLTVTAVRGAGRYDSEKSDEKTMMTAAGVSNLAATDIAATSVSVTWDCVYNDASDVWYRQVGAEEWIKATVENKTSFTATELSAGTEYELMVRTGNKIDDVFYCGDWSATLTFTTSLSVIPTNFEVSEEAADASMSETKAVAALSWTALAGAESYTVVWSASDTMPTGLDATNSKDVTAAEARIDGLDFESTYHFWVRGNLGGVNHTDWTASVSVATGIEAPGEINVVSTTDSLTLKWTDTGVSGYDVRYREVGATEWIDKEGLTNTEYMLTSLEANTAYEIEVRANDGGTDVSAWKTCSASTAAATVTGLAALTASSSAINVSWTDNAVKPAASYTVVWSKTDVLPTVLDANNSIAVTAKKVKITGLDSATAYYFWVRANVTADGEASELNSVWSDSKSATTNLPAPSAFTVEGAAIPSLAEEIEPEITAILRFANAAVPGYEIDSDDAGETLRVETFEEAEPEAGLVGDAVAVVLESNDYDATLDGLAAEEVSADEEEIFTDEFLSELI